MAEDFRTRLVAARERTGLSRRQMAARLLTPRVTYEQWETGARRTPGIAVVAAESLPKTRKRFAARNDDIVKQLREGKTYAAIGRQYGVSKEGVRQIGIRAGVLAPGSRLAKAKARAARRREETRLAREETRLARQAEQEKLAQTMADLVASGLSIAKAARKLGLGRGTMQTFAQRYNLGAITQYGRWRRRYGAGPNV